MKIFSLNPLVKLYLTWLVFIFFFTEILSYLHLISRQNIILGNLIFFAIFIYLFRKHFSKPKFTFLKNKFNLIISLILILTFAQGFFSAPNTTDAMTYHLTRTMYWIQERTASQDFLRSSHDFQPPFAEYILMHLYLLLNNDRLVFLSEWLAFVVTIYLSGVLVYKLGGNEKMINLTKLFVATIPIAVMQASSVQVDIVTNVLAMFGLYFVLDLIKYPTIKDSLMLAVVTGLGMQVKSPFVFYALIPLGLLGLLKLTKLKKEVYIFLIIFSVTFLMQFRYWHQNINLYGNFLGQSFSGEKNTYVNERFDFPALASNIIRNVLNQFPVPFLAQPLEYSLDYMLKAMGTSISDPKTTYPGHEFHVLSVVYPQEDIVSNPIHLLIIILALGLIFKKRDGIKNIHILRTILMMVFISFVLFAYILKYEPYHPRLQIPYFTIGTIVAVMIIFSYRWGNKFLTLLLIPSLLLGFSLILLNVLRPYISYSSFYDKVKVFATPMSAIPEAFYIKPKIKQYFNARFYWYEPYDKVTDLIAKQETEGFTPNNPGSKYIVMNLMDDEFEYPLWTMLKLKNVDFYIQQNKFMDQPVPKNAIILTTSEKEFKKEGYETKCFKTEIDYGYACISVKNDNILDKQI